MFVRVDPKVPLFDNNGNFAVGYEIHTFKAGTSTVLTTYQDRLGASPNTNPVIADARGEFNIYVNEVAKLIYTIPGGDPDSPIWEMDYVGEQQTNFISGTVTPVTVNNNYVVTSSPAVTALTNNMVLIFTPDIDSAGTITSTVFTGTGINDFVATGPYVGSTSGSVISLEIDSVADAIKLLIHADGSGASFVDSSMSTRTVTANGNATQSATWSKFGGKSAAVDGTGDYLSCADSADWFDADDNWTKELTIYPTDVTNLSLMGQYADANNHWYWDFNGTSIRFYHKDSSTVRASYAYTWAPSINTEYALRLVRSGTNLYLYINGTRVTWTTTTTAISTNSLGDIAGSLTIGYNQATGYYLTGYMDEMVIHKGVALSTGAAYDLPTTAYTVGDADTFKWKKDGGSYTTLVPITTEEQILIEGIGGTFAVKTGHTIGDITAITVKTPVRVALDGLTNQIVYKNVNGTLEALGAGDFKANYPAMLSNSISQNAWIHINPAAPALSTSFVSAIRPRKTLNSDHTLEVGDQGYELRFVGGARTLTLLNCAEFSSLFFYATVYSTDTLTINTVDSQSINTPDVPAGVTSISLPANGVYSIQLQSNGVSWDILSVANTPSTSLIYHEENSGVNGTSVSATTWTLLGVNTKEDPGNLISDLTASLFTLTPGSYLIEAEVPIYNSTTNSISGKLRLTDITNTLHYYGLSQKMIGYYDGAATFINGGTFTIAAKVSITEATQFGLYLYTTAATVLASLAVNFSVPERYTTIRISRAV